jgi:predicted oxidoreductase
MKSYQIAHTDLRVSRLAYGCMNIGGSWEAGPMTAEEQRAAIEAVAAAHAHGINFFDHADIYTRGKSEAAFGEALQSLGIARQEVVIQSKCGIRLAGDPDPDSPGRYDFSYHHIVGAVEGSLRRLGTDYLDILLLHRPDPLVEPEEVARAFDTLYRRGQVRYFGVSNHTGPQIDLLRSQVSQPLVVNQIELSLLHNFLIDDGVMAGRADVNYAAAAGTLDYCRRHGILVQAYSPVAGGRLIEPPAGTAERVKRAAEVVAEMAGDKGVAKEAIILAWLLRHPAGIQPVIGTTRPPRIAASCQADDVELSRQEWYTLYIAARGRPVP